MKKNTLHLICNAHLDPVWLWEWEEGAAEVMSTFRTAADLCEEFDSFVFNHNEAILYEWIQEYEPNLFKRIQKLVKQNKWHIMGGWYLQPDCNMPSGESFVRQITYGRAYFDKFFNKRPSTAINFDPFGHTRGLVQIMAKSGFDSYMFCRPGDDSVTDLKLPANRFKWVGYDGSEIIGLRATGGYNSALGKARNKIETHIEKRCEKPIDFVLWGVGNHGGGPSRKDLSDIAELMKEESNTVVLHSTPESYVKDLNLKTLHTVSRDLNQWSMGCYTSQVRIKQKHRQLESEYFLVEKISSHAALAGLLPYPSKKIEEALKDLLFSQFHDILPGSSIQPVEETSIRLMDHGLEILSRIKARAFFKLSAGQNKANEGEIPILAYNPHPYPVTGEFECEFQLADQNWKDEFTDVHVFHKGKKLLTQVEKEESNLNLDWRKKVVFRATLKPSRVTRFDCRLKTIPEKPIPSLAKSGGSYIFKNNDLEVHINTRSGLLESYKIKDIEYLMGPSAMPVVHADTDDPWEMNNKKYGQKIAAFKLMSAKEGSAFSGLEKTIPSVRIIENGPVRTVVEAVLGYNESRICMQYSLPKQGTKISINARVHWNEKKKVLKLNFNAAGQKHRYLGQVAYGVESLPTNGHEVVAQKWTATVSEENKVLTCINDRSYGSSFNNGVISMTLLRSPGYSAHPIMDRTIMKQDRHSPRIDQGEFQFKFWLNAGDKKILNNISRQAIGHHEKPFVLSYFPSGLGVKPSEGILINDKVIEVPACKYSSDGKNLIVRLFEPTGKKRKAILTIPMLNVCENFQMNAFEIKTLKVNLKSKKLSWVDLLEE